MNQEHSKLRHEERQEQAAHLKKTTNSENTREFESVEEVLREDASSIVVPPAVEKRLSQSIQQSPKAQRSWWNRWRKS